MELARGEGFRVWDSEGNEYLDFFGGIVTTISGHAVPEITPEIVEAVKEQAAKIFHSSTLYLIENQVKLAEKLISLSPISGEKKVFFVGSGSEANEAALLFATRYRNSSEIIALRSSYHGGSFMTMGTTGQSNWRPTPRSPSTTPTTPQPLPARCGPLPGDPRASRAPVPTTCGASSRRDHRQRRGVHRGAHTGRGRLYRGAAGLLRAGQGDPGRDDVLLISDEVQTPSGAPAATSGASRPSTSSRT